MADCENNIKVDLKGGGGMVDEWNWFKLHPMADLGAPDFDFWNQNFSKSVKWIHTVLLDQRDRQEILKYLSYYWLIKKNLLHELSTFG